MTPDGLHGQQWRQLAVSIYLPTMLSFIGFGAVTPLIALTAHDLGATVPQAALVVALLGLGSVLGALPAGLIAQRFGERRSLVGSLIVDAACMLAAALAPTVGVLAVAVFVLGLSGAVLMIARQSFLTVYIPFRYRARALSTLGGVFRVGNLLGPLAGAAVVAAFDLRAAYWLAIGTSLAAAATSLLLPDLPEPAASDTTTPAPTGMGTILRDHARTFLTIGLGAAALMLVRASRDALLPLWAASIGLDAAQTSLIFAASSAIDLMLFYLGGSIMDRHGRRAVAVPTMLIMGTCFGLLPLTATG
ncbi:MAG: MFS transporter, partial [Propionibacteriaceae bacterium]|nr:MFS transporter [Propionibacteriaceae bacterium]